jgi:hypothetical protein
VSLRGPGAASVVAHDPRAAAALRELLDAGARPRPAAAVVARLTNTRANELYRAVSESDRSDGQ